MDLNHGPSRVTAVLGPTNTGKTHLAIERMVGYGSGMIGFPLRLLARENYDRVVAIKGRNQVALITGEEKIIPARARYFLCTVESMPADRAVDFLAIDEIQMIGDRERGHIFTERLLNARGLKETMLLGALTARPLLQKLIPDAEYITRPRLSRLTYDGARKITRLPRRSAVVAFSAGNVYVMAELVRQQRGGAAVVLGALSPRTRNAQVEMYQNGEVDYLIATDAIGMGLNMDIDHVAFAEDTKFDGRMPRRLSPQELAQIAGRAGRHMNNGTFGVTGDCPGFDEEVVEAIEEHSFEPLRGMFWRSNDLSYHSLRDLRRTLEQPPPHPFFMRKRDGDDHRALETLSRAPEIIERANARSRVRLLWEVCQVPDFRKTMAESHTRLLTDLYRHLTGPSERLPADWINQQMKRFDKTEGDIDTLAGRISHVRTWTYISHRGDWINDSLHWQQTARAIEDRLSDALHERLTQRFVDKRAAILVQKLKGAEDLLAGVGADGEVTVEGHVVGRLDGMTFVPETLSGPNSKPVLTAARRVLPVELARRVAWIKAAADEEFSFGPRGEIHWRGARVAWTEPGLDPLSPAIRLVVSDLITADERATIEARLHAWLEAQFQARIPSLVKLTKTDAKGAARGVIYQLTEWLGAMPRARVEDLIRTLGEEGRKALARSGVRFGTETVFLPDLLKPRAQELLAILWGIHHQEFPESAMPPAGRVTVPHQAGVPDGFYHAIGFTRLGRQVIRADMTERLAAATRKAARKQPFAITPEMLSLAGVGHEQMKGILADLGYRGAGEADGKPVFIKRRAGKIEQRAGPGGKRRRGLKAKAPQKQPQDQEQEGQAPTKPPRDKRKPRGPKPKTGGRAPVFANRGADEKIDPADSPFAILKTMDVAD
jgi:ATP-dependent RNA helicase SUPV3L1/SUV3